VVCHQDNKKCSDARFCVNQIYVYTFLYTYTHTYIHTTWVSKDKHKKKWFFNVGRWHDHVDLSIYIYPNPGKSVGWPTKKSQDTQPSGIRTKPLHVCVFPHIRLAAMLYMLYMCAWWYMVCGLVMERHVGHGSSWHTSEQTKKKVVCPIGDIM